MPWLGLEPTINRIQGEHTNGTNWHSHSAYGYTYNHTNHQSNGGVFDTSLWVCIILTSKKKQSIQLQCTGLLKFTVSKLGWKQQDDFSHLDIFNEYQETSNKHRDIKHTSGLSIYADICWIYPEAYDYWNYPFVIKSIPIFAKSIKMFAKSIPMFVEKYFNVC